MKIQPPLKGKLTSLYADKGIITQFFGENPNNYNIFGFIGHNGLDIFTKSEDKVCACYDGQVIYTGFNTGGYGWHVKLLSEKENGIYYMTIYAHMSELKCAVGQIMKRGDVLGLEGKTGYVWGYDGTHLHLGWYLLTDPQAGTYQLNFPIGKAFTILNHNNGYGGAVNGLPYLLNNMDYIIIGNEQYLLYAPLKMALNIGDQNILAGLTLNGLSGAPTAMPALPEGYKVYPLVDKETIKDLFGF